MWENKSVISNTGLFFCFNSAVSYTNPNAVVLESKLNISGSKQIVFRLAIKIYITKGGAGGWLFTLLFVRSIYK